jgi:hypothetical protein
MATKFCKWYKKYQNGHEIYQYFPYQGVKKIPKMGFLVCKYTNPGNPDLISKILTITISQ